MGWHLAPKGHRKVHSSKSCVGYMEVGEERKQERKLYYNFRIRGRAKYIPAEL